MTRLTSEIEEKLNTRYSLLKEWLRPITRFGGMKAALLFSTYPGDERGEYLRVHLYTSTHVYAIVARPPLKPDEIELDNGDHGYLGAAVSGRMPLPGEDFTGGRDLMDGPYKESTWNAIVADILAFEIIDLAPERRGHPELPTVEEPPPKPKKQATTKPPVEKK